jgi:hypothetical protein
MHLVCFWPSPTSRARRERQRRASGTRWWVRTARFCVQEKCLFPCKMMMTPVSPHLTPPRLRTGESINAPSLLLAFAHIQGETGTPTGASGTRWWVGTARFCVQEKCLFPCKIMTPVSPHLTPPRLRTGESINAPSLLLALTHTQGEAGTPTEGVGSAVVGRNSPVLCVCRRSAFSRVK